MKVYHGSKYKIENPIAKGSNPNNDYGPAFYLTSELDSAHEWACRNNTIGIVNEYNFDARGLKVLDLRLTSPLTWLAILMHFRDLESGLIKHFSARLEFLEENYYINVNDYDVVVGYRADDAYFRFPVDFIRGNITLDQLEKSFHGGHLGVQIALISEKAINRLSFVKSFDSNRIYLNRYFNKVKEATTYFDSLNKDEDGVRIFDIMRGKK